VLLAEPQVVAVLTDAGETVRGVPRCRRCAVSKRARYSTTWRGTSSAATEVTNVKPLVVVLLQGRFWRLDVNEWHARRDFGFIPAM
jgi:hypothetical protein